MSALDLLQGDSRAKRWIKRHLNYSDQEWCLIWPFSASRNGYAYFGGDHIAVHRLMCEHRNGPPPTPKHQAAHSCGRGHEACVNPWHVSWKTTAENQEERYQHSGPTPRAKLTPEQVDEIRALNGRAKIADIAKLYSISDTNVRHILAGKLWKDTSTLQQRIFNEAEVSLIRSTPWQVKSAKQFAAEFGVGRCVIERIRAGKTYKYFESAEPRAELASPDGNTP